MYPGFPPQPPPGQSPSPTQLPQQVQPYPPPENHDPNLGLVVPKKQSTWAILAGYLGLFSLLYCPLGFLALIFGILGILEIKMNPQKGGMVRCIVGVVLGALCILRIIVSIILFAMNEDARR